MFQWNKKYNMLYSLNWTIVTNNLFNDSNLHLILNLILSIKVTILILT